MEGMVAYLARWQISLLVILAITVRGREKRTSEAFKSLYMLFYGVQGCVCFSCLKKIPPCLFL